MSEMQDKNRETRIGQQKSTFIKRMIICLVIIAIISIVFAVVNKSAAGTEISYNEFQTQLSGGQIKEINLKQSKIQIYYTNGEAHWMYNRNSAETSVIEAINALYADESFTGNIPKLVFGTTTTVSVMSILYPILMVVIFAFMIFFITRQIRGANNKSFDFVKSRARVYPSKTKFTDVAGEDEEKAELEDIVDFLKNPNKYIELGAKIPKGVLLVGPPGTGKTLLARAVAGEAGVPFFTISGSDFMELFVGVGASRVRDLFENAKKSKPCIIFIDEIDAVGRQRGAGMGGGNDEREQTLNQLLVQMDGFEDNEGIIVMAATNRVDILDPALLRPGRFDRRVNINIPDIKGREEILKVHARNKPLDEKVDFKTIARITSGFTGAEIENLLNEAAILVAKENRKKITETDIQKSIMKVTLGPQKKSRVIDEKDKYSTAVHESGHALINRLAKEKSPVQEVSIIPRGGAGGYTLSADDDVQYYYREKLLCRIQMLLGGITAEKLYVGDISTGASNDLKRATDIAKRMVSEWGMSSEIGMVYCGGDNEIFLGRSYQERMPYSENQAAKIDEEVKKIIDMCAKETEKILKENKSVLLTMANVLIEKETIYAEEVDMIISGKSKEEIIEHIDKKDKKDDVKPEEKPEDKTEETSTDGLLKTISKVENIEEKNQEENQEKIAENKQKNENIIDKLLEEAEKREKELLKGAEKQAEKSTEKKESKIEEEKVKETKTAVSKKPKTTSAASKKTTKSADAEEKPKTRKTTTKKSSEQPADKKIDIDKSAESDRIDVTENTD